MNCSVELVTRVWTDHRLPLVPRNVCTSYVGLDLLRHLLATQPQERYTAAQALEHPYFEDLHDPDAGEPICEAFTDYEFESEVLDVQNIRAHIFNEMLLYHPGTTHASLGFVALSRLLFRARYRAGCNGVTWIFFLCVVRRWVY